MKNLFLALLLLFSFVALSSAQVVTTNPSSVNAKEPVTITFKATSTTNPLYNYNGDVYMYTGVNTNNGDWQYVIQSTWLDNNPKCKMTKTDANTWILTMPDGPRTFYGVSESDQIKAIALVIRDGSGNKGTPNDVLLTVSDPGLYLSIIPSSDQTVVVGSMVNVSLSASEICSQMRLLLDNGEIKTASNVRSLSGSYKFDVIGNYIFTGEATSAAYGTKSNSVKITVIGTPQSEPRPAGIRPGINITSTTSVTLCLYAPYKKFVYLIGDFNDWQINDNFLMKKDGDYWWLTLSSTAAVISGEEYAFQYLVDGTLRIADPYADKILDPLDSEISSSSYPNLKPYPTGKTEGIVSIYQTGQTAYNWQVKDFQPADKKNLVIYELLIRDFTEEHTFNAAIQKLDYLKELGINAVELMPVNEFEGNSSWGYNPSFYFAVDKYYGTKDNYKVFIDECHKRGMAVIMDMVLNHSYGQCPLVQLYWNSTTNTPDVDSPWYNVVSPNPTYSWGYDFDHEKPQTQALVDSINSYWMSEYKVDGFRFDFTKGFTQKPGDGWAYDASRIAILKRMRSEIQKRKPNAIVIFEHLTENTEEVELADDDILLWGNMNDNYCQASMGYPDRADLSNSIYSIRGFHQPNLLAYMESHDEERMIYKNLQFGNVNGNYSVKNLNTALDRAKLSACFYLPTPGPKMIWQFGELGYDYSINSCEDGTINNDCRTSPKPVHWDYFSDPARKELYQMYSRLNYLKQHYPTFSTTDFTSSLTGLLKSFVWRNNDLNAFSIGNFNVTAGIVSVSLPFTGKWYEVFSGNEINISSANYTVTLQAGEYRMYTDKKIDFPTGIESIRSEQPKVTIYPNPVKDVLNVWVQDASGNTFEWMIMDLQGQVKMCAKNVTNLNVSGLSQGIYLLKLKTGSNTETIKFIKK